jgi:[ribosomal protein S5]-alanine N-acetyltransferase
MKRATARLELSPCDGRYLEELVALWADSRVSALTTMRVPQSPEQVLELVERSRRTWHEQELGPWDAVERETGSWVGRIGLWELDDWPGPDRFEVGFELLPEYWRRGFASEGATEAVRFGFERGLSRIISISVRENVASRATMERCGLSFEGERVWHGCDVVWYSIEQTPRIAETRGAP